MSNPLVTVIIPMYNSGSLILETINSAFNQTIKDFEIIVVDDGSTDETKEVLKPYVNSGRIRYFYQENSGGPSAGRNKGINESKGDLLAFLDHDDLWMPTKLEKQVRFLKENRDYGMVYPDAYEFTDNNIIIKESKLATNDRSKMSGMIFEQLLCGCFIFLSTVLVRKSVIVDVGGFNPDIVGGEDWDMWIRISKKYKIKFLDEILMGYRRHVNNITNNPSLLSQYLLGVVERIFNDQDVRDKYKDKKKLAVSKIHIRAGYDHLAIGEYQKARSHFLTYIKLSPFNLTGYKSLAKSFCKLYETNNF